VLSAGNGDMRGDKAPPESQNPGTFDAHLAITHTPFGSLHLLPRCWKHPGKHPLWQANIYQWIQRTLAKE